MRVRNDIRALSVSSRLSRMKRRRRDFLLISRFTSPRFPGGGAGGLQAGFLAMRTRPCFSMEITDTARGLKIPLRVKSHAEGGLTGSVNGSSGSASSACTTRQLSCSSTGGSFRFPFDHAPRRLDTRHSTLCFEFSKWNRVRVREHQGVSQQRLHQFFSPRSFRMS